MKGLRERAKEVKLWRVLNTLTIIRFLSVNVEDPSKVSDLCDEWFKKGDIWSRKTS